VFGDTYHRPVRRLPILLLLLFGTGLAAAPTEPNGQVTVIEVGGLLDDATLRFLVDSIEDAAADSSEIAIVQLNSPGAIGSLESLEEAARMLADPPLPLVVWLGPAPAVAGGGAAQLLSSALEVAAAPGTRIENWDPAIAGTDTTLSPPPVGIASPHTVETADHELVDRVAPSIRQLIQDLDDETFVVDGQELIVSTITEAAEGEGITTVPATFTQPGLLHRFFHLGARPEATFFFLVIGLTIAAFEFYAIGPGLAAVAAAIALFVASFGLSVLPVNWWAVAGTLAATWLLTASYQKGGILVLNVLGAGLLTWSGFNFSAGEPQVRTGVAGVVLSVLAVLFFYLLAIPTMGRARFSTRTIGREGLVGKNGKAITDVSPEGVVEVEGARWPATAHRESGIRTGAQVVVMAVQGWRLEVELVREN
jgi:membrane-bound serine protease (ClpP class)